MRYPNKDKYEGQFKDDIINGKGVLLYHDGRKFEGSWKDGMKDGRGILFYPKGHEVGYSLFGPRIKQELMKSGEIASMTFNGAFKNDQMKGYIECNFGWEDLKYAHFQNGKFVEELTKKQFEKGLKDGIR